MRLYEMAELPILKQFKEHLISFFDELISQFPEEPDLIILRIFFNDQISIRTVVENFMHKLITVRDIISRRDETFFLEQNGIFDSLNKDKVNHFKRLWRSGRLDDEDKQIMWKWVDSFVILADKYQRVIEMSASQNF